MTGDCKEQVVVERWELGKCIAELLRCRLSHHVEAGVVLLEISCQRGLQLLWEYLGRKLAQPCLKHAANGVRIVELLFRKQVHVEFCIGQRMVLC